MIMQKVHENMILAGLKLSANLGRDAARAYVHLKREQRAQTNFHRRAGEGHRQPAPGPGSGRRKKWFQGLPLHPATLDATTPTGGRTISVRPSLTGRLVSGQVQWGPHPAWVVT